MLKNFIKLIFLYSLILLLIYSCSPRISRHGNFFTKEEIKILESTKLNKSQILEILGQPSTKSTFSDNIWYYIYFIQKEKAHFKVKNYQNTILKIKFDKKQTVIDYNIIKNNKSVKVTISDDVTDNTAYKRGLVRELLDSFVRRLEDNTN